MASLPPSWMLASLLLALIQSHAVSRMPGLAGALPRPLETRATSDVGKRKSQQPGTPLGLGYLCPSFNVFGNLGLSTYTLHFRQWSELLFLDNPIAMMIFIQTCTKTYQGRRGRVPSCLNLFLLHTQQSKLDSHRETGKSIIYYLTPMHNWTCI